MNNRRIFTVEVDQNNPKVKKYHTMYVLEDTGGSGSGGGGSQQDIDYIMSLIPNQASAQNQLADKNFVNSSISTNTATFRGTFESISDLPSSNINTNDYAFIIEENQGNPEYARYKYNGSSWVKEYVLNNSSFTAAQWAAIQSNITAALVQKLNALPNIVFVEDESQIPSTGTTNTLYMIMEE